MVLGLLRVELQLPNRSQKGLRQGEWKFHGWSGGKRYLNEECTYKDDLKNGPFKTYDNWGLCLSGRYHQNKLNSTITHYFLGKVDHTVQYRDGERLD